MQLTRNKPERNRMVVDARVGVNDPVRSAVTRIVGNGKNAVLIVNKQVQGRPVERVVRAPSPEYRPAVWLKGNKRFLGNLPF